MENSKSIRAILPPPPHHMVGDGFRVHNFFPSRPEIGLTGMSPFFLMDYGAKWNIGPSDKPRGVGVHPHRGIETVTIAYHGRIAHHDSAGNSGVIGEGDVQWMTAGGGVLHKEYHEKEFSRKGGLFQMVQLWMNLPAKYKMTPAKYQSIENSTMGRKEIDSKGSIIEVIAGSYQGVGGPASTFSPADLFNLKLRKDSEALFTFRSSDNTGILVIEGEAEINGRTAPENNFVYFGHEGNSITVKGRTDCILLIMNGEPLNENVVPYGPFVMNTEQEIRQAYQDYHDGKFGYLED
ncbi:MAG: pirin family protein [Bacteroidales bacterium]|nr:pirin family protein [Bacteroidales bacterium]